MAPRSLAVAFDGQVWFTARFTPQAVGRLDPSTGVVTIFLTPSNPGPEGIAASPDGSIWFTQTTKGNIAKIDNAGVITEGKAVKGSGPFGITVAANGDPWYTMMPRTRSPPCSCARPRTYPLVVCVLRVGGAPGRARLGRPAAVGRAACPDDRDPGARGRPTFTAVERRAAQRRRP